MPTQQEPSELTRGERQAVLAAFGFAPQQIVRLLEQDVTVGQLRGMLRLRQCEGVPVAILADLAARIDRIEKLDQLSLDSHAA